ncbi:MAG: acyl carrier protein [Eubacteriales bacterium]
MRDIIIKMLSDKLGVSEAEITDSSDIISDLGADSLDIVELIAEFESQSGIELADEAVIEWKTVGDIVKALGGNV